MPTYTYKCRDNEHYFEQRQKFSDDPVEICPECGSSVRRVINSVGIVFKGSGFYVTDNRSSKGKNGKTRSEKDGGGGGDSAETKSSGDSAEAKTDSGSKSSEKSDKKSTSSEKAASKPKAKSNSAEA